MAVSSNTGQRRARGPNDPGRRDRIAEAAIRIVAERGVPGLTHRAVAAAADVPVGSTTYHFATLDDLLSVALHEASQRNIAQIREWADDLAPDADFAAELAALVRLQLDSRHSATTAAYDLYVAALHYPSLRSASAAWDEALAEIFGSRTDPEMGRILAPLFAGLVLQASLADPSPSRRQLEAWIRRAMGGSPAP
ncbi:TetR family transcriptional regulator [Actinomycetospora endophytica]|uniref:TetR family transcriptional regulator n=1 Tax=Actinomycetospora endophytica TaxID=2291215 RepID=A0ABS8PB99_9PSEU|nr:TetR family transcriptional regulator [Actinomycetospora endophytica]MCD2194696.1 TetR family transcriptional regulator [Actinomycetospora endophytica]